MSLQHLIRRGDSLWALAGRHLGNPARWPELFDYHNEQVGRTGGNRGNVFRIQNPNILFVGQILLLPIRDKRQMSTVAATGAKAQAEQSAIPVDLTIEYAFGNDGAALVYTQENAESVIVTEMRGQIAIELVSVSRYQHNLDLLMSKDAVQCKKKLNEIYSPAIIALMAKPEMIFERGQVVIVSPVAVNSGNKPYVVGMGSAGPLTGGIEPPPVIGQIEVGGRSFKYRAQIKFKVNLRNKRELGGNPGLPDQRGFLSSVGHGVAQAGKGLYNTLSSKDFQKNVVSGFERAGKVAVLVHTAVVIKAVALHTVATTPQAALPITINNMSMAFIDGYPPIPPSTAPGVGIAIVSLAVEWALSPPPWKN